MDYSEIYELLKKATSLKSDGYIYDGFTRIGRIDSSGYVFTNNFNHIGRIEYDGYFYSTKKRIGKMDKYGNIYLDSDPSIYQHHCINPSFAKEILNYLNPSINVTSESQKPNYSNESSGSNGSGGSLIFVLGIFLVGIFVWWSILYVSEITMSSLIITLMQIISPIVVICYNNHKRIKTTMIDSQKSALLTMIIFGLIGLIEQNSIFEIIVVILALYCSQVVAFFPIFWCYKLFHIDEK